MAASERWNGSENRPVFDLEVEDGHEFFAEGVLVHNSTEGGGSYSAGVRMARAGGLFYVEHVVRGQWSSAKRNAVMRQTAEYDGAEVPIVVEQEPGSGGKESAEISVRDLAGFMVRAATVTGDKLTRAGPLAAQAEAGNVKLVLGQWNEAFLAELHGFPEGENDDQVDAAAGAFNRLALSAGLAGLDLKQHVLVGPRLVSADAEW